MNQKTETLDVRTIPPGERFEKIIWIWNSLEPGDILKIINDHDPKPLSHHFATHQPGKYQWEHEQEGHPGGHRRRIHTLAQRVLRPENRHLGEVVSDGADEVRAPQEHEIAVPKKRKCSCPQGNPPDAARVKWAAVWLSVIPKYPPRAVVFSRRRSPSI